MKTVKDIMEAIKFGKEAIDEYRSDGTDKIPFWAYDRIVELYDELVERLSAIGE